MLKRRQILAGAVGAVVAATYAPLLPATLVVEPDALTTDMIRKMAAEMLSREIKPATYKGKKGYWVATVRSTEFYPVNKPVHLGRSI